MYGINEVIMAIGAIIMAVDAILLTSFIVYFILELLTRD